MVPFLMMAESTSKSGHQFRTDWARTTHSPARFGMAASVYLVDALRDVRFGASQRTFPLKAVDIADPHLCVTVRCDSPSPCSSGSANRPGVIHLCAFYRLALPLFEEIFCLEDCLIFEGAEISFFCNLRVGELQAAKEAHISKSPLNFPQSSDRRRDFVVNNAEKGASLAALLRFPTRRSRIGPR